jgi:Fe-S cluster biosynthesis and repair protein YggX
VLTSDAAHVAPLRYLAAIEHAYREALQADPGYAGFLVKTPNHPAWKTCYGPLTGYTLAELAEYVPELPRHIPQRARAAELTRQGFGRNVSIFRALGPDGKLAVGWLHRHATATFEEFQEAVRDYAQALNAAFAVPLPGNELRHIIKSVAKHTWQRWAQARQVFVARQAARGQKSGKVRREARVEDREMARLLKAQGVSYRQIAQQLGVGVMTIYDWFKS